MPPRCSQAKEHPYPRRQRNWCVAPERSPAFVVSTAARRFARPHPARRSGPRRMRSVTSRSLTALDIARAFGGRDAVGALGKPTEAGADLQGGSLNVSLFRSMPVLE